MKNEEKLFQKCMDEGKNYFYKHNNVRPTFMVFYQEMLKHFGEENSDLIERVYYRLIRDLPATKIFGFDSEQFKEKLNSLTNTDETNKIYEQEKNRAKEFLKALNIYRSEYYYKIEEVYKGKTEYDRAEESVYFKKTNVKSGSYKEERLKYYTEGMNNNTLREIFSYEFMSNFSSTDISEKSYAKRIIDKIDERIIIFLSEIKKFHQTKEEAPLIEEKLESTEETTEPIKEIPESAEETAEPKEEILELTEETAEPIEEIPESAERITDPPEEIIEFTEEELKLIEETPESTEEIAEPKEEILELTEETAEPKEEIIEFTEDELKLIKETPKLSEVKTKPTKVTRVSKPAQDKILISTEQVDIVRICEAMYSSGIISAKTEIKQIAQLFFSDPKDIEKFVSNYNSQKKKILDQDSESNDQNLIHFIKILSNRLEKFDIKEIIEHLITISFDK